jgi:hypothetical protein
MHDPSGYVASGPLSLTLRSRDRYIRVKGVRKECEMPLLLNSLIRQPYALTALKCGSYPYLMSLLTEAWSLAIFLTPRSGSHYRRPFVPAGMSFGLISLLLIACVEPAGAQTLHSTGVGSAGSSNGLTHSSQSFGSVNDAVSGTIDAAVPGYTAVVGGELSSESTGSAGGSGHGGKGKMSLSKLQPGGLATNMLFHQVQGVNPRAISGPNGAAQRRIAKGLLDGGAKPQRSVRTASQSRTQTGPVPDISGNSNQGANPEQGAPSNDVNTSDSGSTAFETRAFPEDRESIGAKLMEDPFEGLCQDCGALGNSSVTPTGPLNANGGRESKDRLSSSATRHRLSNMAGNEEPPKTLSVRDARRARLAGYLSGQGRQGIRSGSSDRR